MNLNLQSEAARLVNYITGLVVALLVGLGTWAAGADGRAAIGAAVANLLAFLGSAEAIRRNVFSQTTHEEILEDAIKGG